MLDIVCLSCAGSGVQDIVRGPLGRGRGTHRTARARGPRIVQPVAHAIRPEVQNLQVYSYRYSVSDPSSPSKIHYISQNDKFIPYIRINSHRSSKSLTESGRDRGGSASKRLETAAESQFVDRTCSCWARCARAAPLMLIDVRLNLSV